MGCRHYFSNGQSSSIVVVMSRAPPTGSASMSAQAAQATQPSSRRPVAGSLSTNVSGCWFVRAALGITVHSLGDIPGTSACRFSKFDIT